MFQLSLIAPPIETPTPTATQLPTAQPTACTTVLCFWTQCSSASKSAGAKLSNLAQGYSFVTSNFDRIADQATLLYRVRDEILNTTEEGQRYTDLYYAHSQEIATIMNSNSEIAEQGLDVIDALTPNLQALLDGQGSSATITNVQVQQAQAFLDAILPYASPQLLQAIADEEVHQPLEQLSGLTMSQAWTEINSIATLTPPPTFTPTETPTPTPFPTETATPTFIPSPTATYTPTIAPTPIIYAVTLQPNGTNGMDTYLLSSSSATNYGASADMGIGENNDVANKYARSLLKFDLSSIPADATITSVTLSLWTSQDISSNNGTVNVYRLKTPFNETQATWNRSATGINWQSVGASGVNDRESTPIGSVLILANETLNTEKQIPLDPAKVQEWLNGSFANNGFILTTTSELNDRFNYKTSDTSTSAQRPKLVIQYSAPSP